MATAALGTSEASDGVWVRNSVLEIAPASVHMTINGKNKRKPSIFIHLDFIFEAFVQNMLLSSHSDTFSGIREFFLNTYHKIMQVS